MKIYEIDDKYHKLMPKKPSGTIPPVGTNTEYEPEMTEEDEQEQEMEQPEMVNQQVKTKPGTNDLSSPQKVPKNQ